MTYSIDIVNGTYGPVSNPITVTDSTTGSDNYITFNNTTGHGILITGDTSSPWSTYFSEESIALPTDSGSNTYNLLINPSTDPTTVSLYYFLAYTDYNPDTGDEPVPGENPTYIITINP
jgi:hypothetical protein